ncbi:hypothetical protein GE061_013227 [Apolygus lucorum]|uniref:Gustatory receptor n=1 Tax=Apolygus lucorum TaxID=248454 RepID=A0A8S9XWL8_APOLU|nr:hypothetical protein GE061_013227 [Apolygus lucorum]
MSPYSRSFKLSRIWLTVTILYIVWTAYNSTFIFILMHKLNQTFKLSPYSLILERAQTSIVTIVMILSLCLSIANVRHLGGLMESFVRADKDLRSVGVFVSPSRKFGLIAIGIRLTIVLSILYKELRATAGTVTQLMIQYLIIAPMTMAFVPEIQFMVLVNAVNLRVSTMIADMKTDVVNRYCSKFKKLQAFIIVHSFLVDSCSTINSLYQVQILLIVSSIFINSTANAYHVIEKTVNLINHFSEADALTLTISASRVVLRSYENLKMEGVRDIYSELHPVFLVSQFLGLAPYTYHYQVSQGFSVVTGVMMLLTLGTSGWVMTREAGDQNTFSLILDRGQILLLGITTITALAKSLLNASALADLAKNYLKIDVDLKGIGVFVSHSFRFGLLNVIIRFLIVFPVILLDLYIASPLALTDQFVRIISQIVTFIIEVQFVVLVHSVRTRVLTMIRHMSALAAQPYSYKPKKLVVMTACHSSLVEMVSQINDLFTVQMLLIMFTIFLLATAHLYHLIDAITTTAEKDYLVLASVSFKVCLRSFEIWTVTTVCVRAQDDIKEFNSMLYQVMIEDESGTLADNKKLQLHVSMKKEVEFTAYNFFPIDYTLVHSMISAATTYLVILVQFSSISTPEATTPAPAATTTFKPTINPVSSSLI